MIHNTRQMAVQKILGRTKEKVVIPSGRISEYFGEHVFNQDAMQRFLSQDAYEAVQAAISEGSKIDRSVADQVAAGMKDWAITKGAKSFTHWFQPLTGSTAEKHDTFFEPIGNGKSIENFSGGSLTQQEPDASSFPNGGIRQTFEARGYTAWDPSSPAFMMQIGEGVTLCIPTIFVSYTGESLDYKAPLLKSTELLEQAALPVVRMFDKQATKVSVTLGWEQEYFIVDEAFYNARPDLAMAGRTLVGHIPAKGQQLDDHYFGSIPERVYDYMLDMEQECHKLGIPLRTRHNEVAPGQYECAPMFEEVNVAVDHNQLLMNVMDRVAKRHKLRVLFHEKPFANINGSGKHNNWSMSTDTGKNLLSPRKTPKNNLLFLTFFVNVIKAVHSHSDLIRAIIASAGNDHRLGANEAPPAIISIFIGKHLTAVLNEVKQRVKQGKFDELTNADLKLDIHNKIPDLLLDNTDRNRTSPFAFTGNKFEVRAVGSATNCASPMTVLNTIVGQQLKLFKQEVDALIKEGEKKEGAILRVIRRYITDADPILFEGDNYSNTWEKEAKKRGLSNVKTTPHALDFLVAKGNKEVFIENGIYSEAELHARYEVLMEEYAMKIQIEGRVLADLVKNFIMPAAVEYQNKLATNIQNMMAVGYKKKDIAAQNNLLKSLNDYLNEMDSFTVKMIDERKKANAMNDAGEKAKAYCDKVKPLFDEIRYRADKIEQIIEDRLWPLPKYREILFQR